MYQTIEAEIGPDGVVTLHEPIRPPGRFLAMVTILTPLDATPPVQENTWIDQLWSHRTPIVQPIHPLGRDEAHER